MPNNQTPQRGPTQEERRRLAAARKLGGGGTPNQNANRIRARKPSRLEQISAIVTLIVLIALVLSLVPSCLQQTSAAGLVAPTSQDVAPAPVSVGTARFLQRESAEEVPTASQAAPASDDPAKLYVGETGHYITDQFLTFWKGQGGADVFGNPLSEQYTENNRTVQLFEKALLELHPEETDPKNQVQLAFLGRELADARGLHFTAQPLASNSATRTFYQETGQLISGQFKTYWDKNNGLAFLGLPISGEVKDGTTTVQYFERGVLSLDNSDPNATVQSADAGQMLLDLKGWERPTRLGMELDIDGSEIYQGRTLALRLQPDSQWAPTDLKGSVGDEVLKWIKVDNTYRAFKSFSPWADVKTYPLSISYTDGAGRNRTLSQPIVVDAFDFPLQNLYLPDDKTDLTDEATDDYDNAQLANAYNTFTDQLLWKGVWSWPVYGEITTQFGEHRAYGDSTNYNLYHGGLDIAVPLNTAVAAPADGKVIYTGLLEARGNAVGVDHGGGVTSYYFHLSRILVKPGDILKKGQILGQVGTTGRSTGPHLHWEVRVNGTITYPLLFVNKDLSEGWN